MKIKDIAREAKETLEGCEALSGIPVLLEDAGSVDAKLAADVAKCGCCVIVGWSGFTATIRGETAPDGTPFGTVGIVASVFDKPSVTRAKAGAAAIGDIAIEIAKALDGAIAEGMEAPLWLKSIGKTSDLGGNSGTVTCDVNFETKASL